MNAEESQPALDIGALVARIRAGRDEVMSAVSALMASGGTIPAEIEYASLRYHVAEDPARIDLKRRMTTVARQNGFDIEPDLVEEVRAAMIADEHGTDFQELLDEYGRKVRFADLEPEFMALLPVVRQYTMGTVERLHALWQQVGYVCDAKLEGDIVECGVWRGGSMMLAALELVRRETVDRRLWLYDTFAGLPRPDPIDVDVLGNRAVDGWEAHTLPGGQTLWAYADEADVRRNMALTGYPEQRMRFVPGLVEETIPATAPQRISLLRIDTDWYASYRHVLRNLYDRVVPGGVLIFDDYGHFGGARKAVDEFRAGRRIVSPLMRADYSCRIMLKLR
jgi:O-methyltransferase